MFTTAKLIVVKDFFFCSTFDPGTNNIQACYFLFQEKKAEETENTEVEL